MQTTDSLPPAVPVASAQTAPVAVIDPAALNSIGQNLTRTFDRYRMDRYQAEQKWLRNLRQYLGIYDPDIVAKLSANMSQAYPRITRVKCISVLSRIMNLMFPGNERNWELKASPSPDMAPEDVMAAIQKAAQKAQEMGVPVVMDDEFVEDAVEEMACERAHELSELIDDQLQEIGGDQTLDYVALNRKVLMSGIIYSIGVLRGPFVRKEQCFKWIFDPMTQQPAPQMTDIYKPMYEFVPVWDFYPDMSAKTLEQMDGYFIRLVVSRSQLRKLAERSDFFPDQIRNYIATNTTGNYKAQAFETELKGMGVRVNSNDQPTDPGKYEILVWNGMLSADDLAKAGVDVPPDRLGDDIDAEVWMVGNTIIKAQMNPWRKLGRNVKTIHTFVFDEDDTSPLGNGLPNVVRDSQMSVCAATRMLLDNASVVSGPNLELNLELLRQDQDLKAISPYKIWYREGTSADAGVPAVRTITIDGHIDELTKIIDMFMRFADMETFVGPATGGDMEKTPSEPFRTAAGASMLRGDAALPFKDIVRNFDTFTQSVINSLVEFNKLFNAATCPPGDYNVIARGATSLVAKEIKGIQLDTLAQTLRPGDELHIDDRKFVEARFKIRDLGDMLVSEEEAKRRKQQQDQMAAEVKAAQDQQIAAEVRKTLAEAFKNITQGAKNSATADAQSVQAALSVLMAGNEQDNTNDAGSAKSSGNSSKTAKK